MACSTARLGATQTLVTKQSTVTLKLLSNCSQLPIRNARRGVMGVRACDAPRANEGVAKETEAGDEPKKLSKQSSWEAKDVLGNDYLYRLGNEASNMNIEVGAKAGNVDYLFHGDFLGKEGA